MRRTFSRWLADIRAEAHDRKKRFDEANDQITQRSGRNLFSAILIGVVLAGTMIVSLVVIKELFMVLAAVLVAFSILELVAALQHAKIHVPRIPSVIAGIALIPAAFYWGAPGQWLVALAGMLLVTIWRISEQAVLKHPTAHELFRDLGAGIFVQVWVAFLASTAVLLLSQDGGQWWVLAFIVTVVLVDVGAYVTGLNFGRHPMAPTISPNKTWEGFAGATAAALIGGALLAVFMLSQPWWVGVIFGTIIAATATVGDLSESLLKRDIGVKDMSSWLPGHGGFLDRLDSMLLSAPAASVLWIVFAH